jgi:signal transduction histidine kinase
MGFGLSKIHPYQLLFALCVAVPYLNMFELTFAVWALSAVLTLSNKYSMTLFRYVACFAAILGIAIVVMFFKSYYLYYIIRDITYMVKPIIGLILGYQLCKKNTAQAFDTIVITGFLIAVIHIIVLVIGDCPSPRLYAERASVLWWLFQRFRGICVYHPVVSRTV